MKEDKSVITAPESDTVLPWFVIQLKPNSELTARRNLERQGVRIFAPFEEVTRRKGHRLDRVHRLLFPGYLFVSFDPHEVRWRTINSTMGVNRLVSFTVYQPAQVPGEFIKALQQRCDDTGRLLPPDALQRGDCVRISSGPLTDLVGKVEQIAADERIWVLLDILGKNTRVVVRTADLQRAV